MAAPILSLDDRVLTELDQARILGLMRRTQLSPTQREALEDLLDASDVVPAREVPADVITMNSRFQIREAGSDTLRDITLCYPEDARAEEGHLSLLSPMGAGLLGCRVGGQAAWLTPTGESRSAQIVSLQYQPEASGQFTV